MIYLIADSLALNRMHVAKYIRRLQPVVKLLIIKKPVESTTSTRTPNTTNQKTESINPDSSPEVRTRSETTHTEGVSIRTLKVAPANPDGRCFLRAVVICMIPEHQEPTRDQDGHMLDFKMKINEMIETDLFRSQIINQIIENFEYCDSIGQYGLPDPTFRPQKMSVFIFQFFSGHSLFIRLAPHPLLFAHDLLSKLPLLNQILTSKNKNTFCVLLFQQTGSGNVYLYLYQ